MGKEATAVNADPAPPPLMAFPGVRDIRIAASVEGDFDAAIIMECGDLKRTGVSGLERFFVINIDHHPGNTGYGQINWFDPGAAACAEMVYDVVRALGVPLTRRLRPTSTWRSSPTPDRSTTRASRRGRSTSAASASRRASIRCWSRATSTTATTWAG